MEAPPLRVVFDTSTVLSALIFAQGRLSWLRAHWRLRGSQPLASRTTLHELVRVLAYPKFRLTEASQVDLLSEYLPYCQVVETDRQCKTQCRDVQDQPLLDLAESAEADVLVSSDSDLLVLRGQTSFVIESPEEFRQRVEKPR